MHQNKNSLIAQKQKIIIFEYAIVSFKKREHYCFITFFYNGSYLRYPIRTSIMHQPVQPRELGRWRHIQAAANLKFLPPKTATHQILLNNTRGIT